MAVPEIGPGVGLSHRLGELAKAARFAGSFVARGMVHVNLQLLYDCDFRCRICDFWKPSHEGLPQLSIDQVRTISAKLARIGPQIVSIGGGEPLRHPDIVEVAATLAAEHFPVLITNGWHVTPDLARALFSAGLYEISVSVDYASPERHDAQRGISGAHEKALEALRILHESRTSPWQRVHLILVLMDDNLDEVEPLLDRCRRMGLTFLLTLYSDARGAKSCRAASADASRRLLDLKRKHPHFVALRGYVGRFSEAIERDGVGPCRAGQNLMNVDSQGAVSLCIDRRTETVGNLLTDEPEEIVRRLRQRHRENGCRSCWTSCRGSIETILYGADRLGNLRDYWQMVRPVPL